MCVCICALSCLPVVLSGPTRSALQAMLANLGTDDDLPGFESESSSSPNSSEMDEVDAGMLPIPTVNHVSVYLKQYSVDITVDHFHSVDGFQSLTSLGFVWI